MPTISHWDLMFLSVVIAMSVWGGSMVVAEAIEDAAAHCAPQEAE